VNKSGNTIVSLAETDPENVPGGPTNGRLLLVAADWARRAVTREIDYRLFVPRFAPSERAWLLGRDLVSASQAAAAAADCDGDDL
jgi:hypothetical protein